MPRSNSTIRAAVALAFSLATVHALAAPEPGALPARTHPYDASRRIDVNSVNLRVSNYGQFPYDLEGYPGSALFPRGTGNSLLFASGLWLGGTVTGLPRLAVAEYAIEFAPGAMAGGAADDPWKAEYAVYKVARWTGASADSAHVNRSPAELTANPTLDPLAHHSWSEYMAGAVPHGAPWRTYRLPNTATPGPGDSLDVPGPDVRGDVMLWCVFNDADPARHLSPAGSTAPLGVEVRQTVFGYDRPGPLGNTVFVRWDVFNRGTNAIPDLRMGLWSDPDVGLDIHDDVAGCDTTRSLAYVYNTFWGSDPAYGYAKPAVGFDLLAEHDSPALLRPSGMDAFIEYVNGTDPSSAAASWNLMQGLQQDGSPFLDPATSTATPFLYAGDPIASTGWLDPVPSNNKSLVTSGPWAFAPGDSLTFWVAIVVGQGETPAASLLALRCASDDVQDVFDAGFAEPFVAPRACATPSANCPRGADWWAAQCAAGAAFSPAQWNSIARWADSASTNFTFAGPNESAPYCAVFGATATTRDSARREYLAVLSNVGAGLLGLTPADGQPARLTLETGVNVAPLLGTSLDGVYPPPLIGTTVAVVLREVPLARRLWNAGYENDGFQHRRALTGVDAGLPFFFGGAGPAALGSGSALEPSTMPDSFPTVLLRFDRTAGQKAYRYLRLETTTGGEPSGGRAYRYAGHRIVPLTAWDLRSGMQVELAFSERAVTLADGTLLAGGAQPATFDSTWAPNASADGGQERLWVLARPYAATPRGVFATDGVPLAGGWPALYQLDARLRADFDVFDDGDGFRFLAGWPPTWSAEALLAALETAAPADTEAQRLRSELAAGLRSLNLGIGIGPVCVRGTPFAATLVEATVTDSHVRLRWRLGEPATAVRLERLAPTGVWLDAGALTLEPGGYATTEFDAFEPGRHGYRLVAAAAIGIARSEVLWLDTPSQPALTLTGVWPNPAGAARRLSFTLPSPGAAKLEVFDLNGRRAYERDLGTLAAGLHHVEIAPGRRLRPGVYFAVLRFGGERRSARFVAL